MSATVYHGKTKLLFDNDACFVQDQHMLVGILDSASSLNNSSQINMSVHCDTLSWV